MHVVKDISEARCAVMALRLAGRSVGLVPTMGALHEGHRSLMRVAAGRCDAVAVTIFVNPRQFGPAEDLAAYPRPIREDLAACEAEGVAIVFTPEVATMYPPGATTAVHVAGLTEGLCGAHRPGHFDGVATIVTKLFNILPADAAFFGEKDYQQLQVIRRFVADLNIPIEIVGCPTVREADGLALSSRNVYLSAEHRAQAPALHRAMQAAAARVAKGERDVAVLSAAMRAEILAAGPFSIDYVEIVDADSLAPLARVDRPARICLAVRIGGTRLIDNLPIAPG